MTDWIKFKDQKPPMNKSVLIGAVNFCDGAHKFIWDRGRFSRPYDRDKKFNENYYVCSSYLHSYGDAEREVTEDFLWAEVEEPVLEDIEND